MSATPSKRTGAQLLVDSLILHGSEMAFGVPGVLLLPIHCICSAICATEYFNSTILTLPSG